MSDQLLLLDQHPAWRLDASTRECGRRGVASARAVLLESRARARTARLAGETGETGEVGEAGPTESEPAESDPAPPAELAPAA